MNMTARLALTALLALSGCAGLVCPPKFLDPDYCYAWGIHSNAR